MEPLHTFALGLPEAYEDHPWGENVAKVGKKVFVFFGLPNAERPFGMTVKLPDSYYAAMSLPWARNPGYRMDRGHWAWLHPRRRAAGDAHRVDRGELPRGRAQDPRRAAS